LAEEERRGGSPFLVWFTFSCLVHKWREDILRTLPSFPYNSGFQMMNKVIFANTLEMFQSTSPPNAPNIGGEKRIRRRGV